MKKILLPLILLFTFIIAHSQSGSITNIQVSQRTDGSGLVDLHFDLTGDGNAYNILLEVSFQGGDNYIPVPASFLAGDLGHIAPGEQKHIIWDGIGSFPNTYSTKAQLRIISSASGPGGNGLTGQPCPGMPTFTDSRDGNVYNTVQIGDQCWLKENLKYLPEVSPSLVGSQIDPHYYVNGYQGTSVSEAKATDNYQNYGVFYNWPAALNGQGSSSSNQRGVQGVCPAGWHLPSHDEWTELEQFVCQESGNFDCNTKFPYDNTTTEWRGTNEGNALKSCRQVDSPLGWDCAISEHPRWDLHSTHYGTDQFGFSAFPGGDRNGSGTFAIVGSYGSFWSSTEYSSSRAWIRHMIRGISYVSRTGQDKEDGYPVRCVRDE